MYEVDGIVYAGTPTPTKSVIHAKYLGNFVIRVAFNTGEIVDVDFRNGFEGTVFAPLKDEAILQAFEISHGTLTWCNEEIDIAPEYLLDIGKIIESAVTA